MDIIEFFDKHPWLPPILVLATSAFFIWRQLGATLRIQRRELYSATTEVSDEYFKTSLLHWRDHFDPAVYEARYRGDTTRSKSYLLMKRKYIYLVFLDSPFAFFLIDRFNRAGALWLRELVRYQEFRDVHAFNGKYYRGFAMKVDGLIGATTCVGWFCDPDANERVQAG